MKDYSCYSQNMKLCNISKGAKKSKVRLFYFDKLPVYNLSTPNEISPSSWDKPGVSQDCEEKWTEINYKRLYVASAANYHLGAVRGGRWRFAASRLSSHTSPEISCPSGHQRNGSEPGNTSPPRIHNGNKSGIVVIHLNQSRRMRDKGCSVVRELQQHTEERVEGHERNEWCVKSPFIQGNAAVIYRWLLGSFMGAAAGSAPHSKALSKVCLADVGIWTGAEHKMFREGRGSETGTETEGAEGSVWVNTASPPIGGLTSSDLDDPCCHGD